MDVGHTATSPGADSARGVPEYEFNLKLADVIAQSLHEAGFDKTIRLVTSGSRLSSLFERAASANNLHGDLFISIHHDSVPDNLKETWQYEGKKYSYSDRFSGYAIFVSHENVDRDGSLAFGHSLGQELQKRGYRQEELALATPERRLLVAQAVTAAVEEFCTSRIQSVAGQPGEQSSQYCNHQARERHQAGVTLAS